MSAEDAVREAFQRHAAGESEAAARVAEAALAVYPEHGNLLAVLGRLAFDAGRYDDAAAWHGRAVRAEPKSAVYLCNLGNSELARGRAREALAAFERAGKLDPTSAAAVMGKAGALERRGKAKMALRALAGFARDGVGTGGAAMPAKGFVVAAQAHYALGEYAAVLEWAERGAARGDLPPGAFGRLALRAGQAADKLGDVDTAWSWFERGNAALAVPFDPEPRERGYDRLRATFTADALAARPRATQRSSRPVFIVGMPRSGSTLVEQILHAHPDAFGAGEVSDLGAALRPLAEAEGGRRAYPEGILDLDAPGLDRVAADYLARLGARAPKATRIVDKALHNYEHLGAIALLCPDATILHVRRHPLDLCLSCWMQPLPPLLHPYATDLAALGRMYRAYDALMRHWTTVLGDRIVPVDYEALIGDPEGETRRLLDACGLPWDARCLNFQAARRDVATLSYDQVRQPLYRDALARFERYGTKLDPLRAALGDVLDVE